MRNISVLHNTMCVLQQNNPDKCEMKIQKLAIGLMVYM